MKLLLSLSTMLVLSACTTKEITTREPTTLAPATASQSQELSNAVIQASNSQEQNTQINTTTSTGGLDINAILQSLGVNQADSIELLTNTGKNIFNDLDVDNSQSVTLNEIQQSNYFQYVPEAYKQDLFDYLYANNNEVRFDELATKVLSQVDKATVLSVLQGIQQ